MLPTDAQNVEGESVTNRLVLVLIGYAIETDIVACLEYSLRIGSSCGQLIDEAHRLIGILRLHCNKEVNTFGKTNN